MVLYLTNIIFCISCISCLFLLLVATFHVVGRQHSRLPCPLHGAVHPALIDCLSVDDDVTVPKGDLIVVLGGVVIQCSVNTLPTYMDRQTELEANLSTLPERNFNTDGIINSEEPPLPLRWSLGVRWWIWPTTCWFGACSRGTGAAAASECPAGTLQEEQELRERERKRGWESFLSALTWLFSDSQVSFCGCISYWQSVPALTVSWAPSCKRNHSRHVKKLMPSESKYISSQILTNCCF